MLVKQLPGAVAAFILSQRIYELPADAAYACEADARYAAKQLRIKTTIRNTRAITFFCIIYYP